MLHEKRVCALVIQGRSVQKTACANRRCSQQENPAFVKGTLHQKDGAEQDEEGIQDSGQNDGPSDSRKIRLQNSRQEYFQAKKGEICQKEQPRDTVAGDSEKQKAVTVFPAEQQKTAAGVNQDQYELKERQKTQDVIRIQSSISFCKGGMEKIMDSAGEGCQRQKKNKLCRFCFRIRHIFVAGCHIRASFPFNPVHYTA